MTDWKPTHRVTVTPKGEKSYAFDVRAEDGVDGLVLYTKSEWDNCDLADLTLENGTLYFQGQIGAISGNHDWEIMVI